LMCLHPARLAGSRSLRHVTHPRQDGRASVT
jgi:hypothetical protein